MRSLYLRNNVLRTLSWRFGELWMKLAFIRPFNYKNFDGAEDSTPVCKIFWVIWHRGYHLESGCNNFVLRVIVAVIAFCSKQYSASVKPGAGRAAGGQHASVAVALAT